VNDHQIEENIECGHLHPAAIAAGILQVFYKRRGPNYLKKYAIALKVIVDVLGIQRNLCLTSYRLSHLILNRQCLQILDQLNGQH
jgi:hypothetical protein